MFVRIGRRSSRQLLQPRCVSWFIDGHTRSFITGCPALKPDHCARSSNSTTDTLMSGSSWAPASESPTHHLGLSGQRHGLRGGLWGSVLGKAVTIRTLHDACGIVYWRTENFRAWVDGLDRLFVCLYTSHNQSSRCSTQNSSHCPKNSLNNPSTIHCPADMYNTLQSFMLGVANQSSMLYISCRLVGP